MAASEGRLRVVTFDLDDTLWDTRAAIKIASASFFSAGGLADPRTGTNGNQAPYTGSGPNFFFVYATIVDAAVRRCQKCGNRTIASEPAALDDADRPKWVRLEFGGRHVGKDPYTHIRFLVRVRKMSHVALQLSESESGSGLY
jgi:FMN phosphatase YigB (HAD superfamily)